MHDGWGWWMVFGWLWMLVFWGLIIWAVYAVVTRLGERPGGDASRIEPTALDILERRYASGEISADEFEEMRRRLRGFGGSMARSA
jgi:putative membrane protein